LVATYYSHLLPSSVGLIVGIFKMLENKKPFILMAYVINMIPCHAPSSSNLVLNKIMLLKIDLASDLLITRR